MKYIIILLFLIFGKIFWAQDSLSVLFIGNSYTYTFDLPNVFKNLANSLGDGVFVDSKTNGGFTFQNHVNDPITFQKMHSQDWDYVVIQGQSQEPSFPYSQVNSSTLPYAVQLADSVKANYLCSQVNYFMTWGRQNGDPQWDSINTFDKMNLRLRNAYMRIADSAQSSVTPAGIAWKYVRDNFPTINLFSSDGSHPSLAGTYLNACTFYASLFHKSPVGSPYLAGLDQFTAETLQNISAIVVLDSMGTWKLKHHDSLVQANFTMNQTNPPFEYQFESNTSYVTNFFWEFGDGLYSTEPNPNHTYSESGAYQIILIGESVCGVDTAFQTIQITTTELNELGNNIVNVFSDGNGNLHLVSKIANAIESFKLFNLMGEEISYDLLEKSNNEIILNSSDRKILLIRIETKFGLINKTIYLNE
jgi:PKD repeat protein